MLDRPQASTRPLATCVASAALYAASRRVVLARPVHVMAASRSVGRAPAVARRAPRFSRLGMKNMTPSSGNPGAPPARNPRGAPRTAHHVGGLGDAVRRPVL